MVDPLSSGIRSLTCTLTSWILIYLLCFYCVGTFCSSAGFYTVYAVQEPFHEM